MAKKIEIITSLCFSKMMQILKPKVFRPRHIAQYALAIVLFIALSVPCIGKSKTRILCFGNQITLGWGMIDSTKNSYPKQLEFMLGVRFEVSIMRNNGATFANLDALLDKRANIVFLEADSSIYRHSAEFAKIVTRLKRKGIRVIILWPFQAAAEKKENVNKIAVNTGIELIDISRILVEGEEKYYKNGQLSPLGAAAIAQRLYETVKLRKEGDFNIARELKLGESNLNFHGFEGYQFNFRSREAKVIRPKIIAHGRPWIWRARFWGHEPQVDIGLLERGYHLVYCDVAELFGNEEALQIWDGFYKKLIGGGLNKKSAMEGMSRGGIYVYNWLLRHPDRVSAVYADAPVLDFKSWPGGKKSAQGSITEWEIFKRNYGLDELQASQYDKSPLDRAEEIAGFNIPLLHVLGDNDEIVPPAENTLPFAVRIRESGGTIELIHKPDVGHHPHCLADPSPIINFILRAEGRKINFATIATPGAEYRDGAAWLPNGGWWGEFNDIDRILSERKDRLDILFLGNSIMQGIGGTRRNLSYKPGLQAFEHSFSEYSWDCAGIAGDRTQQLLWRLQNGKYKRNCPKILVMSIGVNNITAGNDANEIVQGIMAVKNWIVKNMPSTKLVLLGPLPVGHAKDDLRRSIYNQIHDILKKDRMNKRVIYYPMEEFYVQEDGSLRAEDYSSDGIHLKIRGYEKLAAAIKLIITQLMLPRS